MRQENLKAVLKKLDGQLQRWSERSLSLLGRILILKTYGVSQVIYLMQSLTLEQDDIKMLNCALYKFLWNRRYRAKRKLCGSSFTGPKWE